MATNATHRILAFVITLALCCGGLTRGAAAEPALEINAILELTGQAAFLGESEANALRFVEQVTNRKGGINGRLVHFVIADDQSNPQVALQLANALIAKNVAVLMGPGLSATCNAVMPLVTRGPVMFCMSSAIRPVSGGYAFSTTIGTSTTFPVGMRYFRERGWTRWAVLASVDATGQDAEQSIDAAMARPENRAAQIVARERFMPADISLSAQVAHIRSSGAQAILLATSGTPFGTALHSLSDAGVSLPVFAPSSNMTKTAMTQYAAYLPVDVYFASLIGVAPGTVGKGPILDAQRIYFDTLRAHRVESDSGYTVTWDAGMRVIDAYRQFGAGMTAEQLHDYLEKSHGWVGINGVYDYRDGAQRGLTESAVVIYRWDRARGEFSAASRPGGRFPERNRDSKAVP